MKKLQLLILKLGLSALLIAPVLVFADDQKEFEPVPEPPVLPDPVESGEALEPEITIIRRDDAIITEYRVNGNLYMVKIVPAFGPPYYLIDRDGDGQMEGRINDIYDDIIVPQWVLFSW
ncbi:MAG: DUF2782 domain-containing protein [Gammaproteobacteria bacterium]|nr:MAG: DUF2782 domain-containing protein [Gammaproteobacteria bacterium]